MIPSEQQELFNYMRMFRGNHMKGATLLESYLMNGNRANEILNNIEAMTAVFADMGRSNVDALCASKLLEYGWYYDYGLMTYLHGNGYTAKTTINDVVSTPSELVNLLQWPYSKAPMANSPTFINYGLKLKSNYDTFVLSDVNRTYLNSIIAQPKVMGCLTSLEAAASSSSSHLGAIQAAISAAGYQFQNWGGCTYIAKWNQMLVGVASYKSGYGYYAHLVRYDLTSGVATVLYTDTSYYDNYSPTSGNYYSHLISYPVWDDVNNCVYCFYNYNVYVYGFAGTLTQGASSLTATFTPKNIGQRYGWNPYQIINVTVGNGKASVAWEYQSPYSGGTTIMGTTVRQDGSFVSQNYAVCSGTGYSGSSSYGNSQHDNCLGWSYANGYYSTYYSGATIQTAIPDGSGGFQGISWNFYAQNSSYYQQGNAYIFACPRKDFAIYYAFAPTSSNSPGNSALYIVKDTRGWQLNGATNATQQTPSGFKYDPFLDAAYFVFNNTFYRVSNLGVDAVTAAEYNVVTSNYATALISPCITQDTQWGYKTLRNGTLLNIQPALINSIP